MIENNVGVRIPMFETNTTENILSDRGNTGILRKEVGHVLFFPDELPEDPQILSDILKSEFSTFKVWRSCAVSCLF